MKDSIFVITHKKYKELGLPGYQTLHAGREGKEDLGYLGDNTGDHISEKNGSFCELTGIYWLYKNVTCDVIGVCHYRRYFHEPSANTPTPISISSVKKLLSTYDIIIPRAVLLDTSVYTQFKQSHNSHALLLCRSIIENLFPDYLDAFDYCMGSSVLSGCNMIIASKAVFDHYCDFLFPILFELEHKLPPVNGNTYQQRIFGFVSERLLRVWLMMQPYLVYEADFYNTDQIKQ